MSSLQVYVIEREENDLIPSSHRHSKVFMVALRYPNCSHVQNIGVCFIKVLIPLGSLDIKWWQHLQCGLSMLIIPFLRPKWWSPFSMRTDRSSKSSLKSCLKNDHGFFQLIF